MATEKVQLTGFTTPFVQMRNGEFYSHTRVDATDVAAALAAAKESALSVVVNPLTGQFSARIDVETLLLPCMAHIEGKVPDMNGDNYYDEQDVELLWDAFVANYVDADGQPTAAFKGATIGGKVKIPPVYYGRGGPNDVVDTMTKFATTFIVDVP